MSNPLLRTLISEMVETYLEESVGQHLIESIFEEVSEETWEAIEEAILNELSEETYDLYLEGSIKGSGTDRKAVLKRSFRAGQTDKYNDMADRGMHSGGRIKKQYTGSRAKPGVYDRNSVDRAAQDKSAAHKGFSNQTDSKDETGRRNANNLSRKSDSKVNSMVKRNAIRQTKPNLPK